MVFFSHASQTEKFDRRLLRLSLSVKLLMLMGKHLMSGSSSFSGFDLSLRSTLQPERIRNIYFLLHQASPSHSKVRVSPWGIFSTSLLLTLLGLSYSPRLVHRQLHIFIRHYQSNVPIFFMVTVIFRGFVFVFVEHC